MRLLWSCGVVVTSSLIHRRSWACQLGKVFVMDVPSPSTRQTHTTDRKEREVLGLRAPWRLEVGINGSSLQSLGGKGESSGILSWFTKRKKLSPLVFSFTVAPKLLVSCPPEFTPSTGACREPVRRVSLPRTVLASPSRSTCSEGAETCRFPHRAA